MHTSFEQFAAAGMLGEIDAPPRNNGEFLFRRAWEGRAFGMAIALSKKGHYEWEDFRRELILSIAEWEDKHGNSDPEWDYYQQWLLALERQLIKASLLSQQELHNRTIELLERKEGAV
jgi:nitrile hydratase subunit beta